MPGRRGRKRKIREEAGNGALNEEVGGCEGSAGVDFGGECGKGGALGRGDGVGIVENCSLDASCNGLVGGEVEVSGNAVSVPVREREVFRVTDGENLGDDIGGKHLNSVGIDQMLEENGGVEGCDCGELKEKKCDLLAGEGRVEGELCTRGEVEHSSKKRKRQLERGKVDPNVPLRRSARRAAMATTPEKPIQVIPEKPILATPKKPVVSPAKPSRAKAASVAKHLDDDCEDVKLELPPSSTGLNLDGLHVLDIFSVYSCLRSFSTSLFLSPFNLEAFVEALHCRFANSLIDSIHFSVLVALKKHLESLSEEKNALALDCLRALNWELLDLVNWPFYLIEYSLLFHASALEACFKLSSLNLLDGEYYKQPGKVKLQILRFLSDDLVEGDFIRSELQGQMVTSEPNIDFDQIVAPQTQNEDLNGDYLPTIPQSPVMGEGDIDRNIDDCCLCKMDGVLICCDGCPAAFHSRCVGIAKDTLPEGEWYCPECLVGKPNSIEPLKSFRGAELLGIDTHGRIYFGSCGYLLVSDVHDADACRYYNKCDIGIVINILSKSSNSLCNEITSALSLYWGEEKKIQCEISSFSSPLKSSGEMAAKRFADCSAFIKESGKIDSVVADALPEKDNSTTRSRRSIGNHSTLVRVTHETGGYLSTCPISMDIADASTKQECRTEQGHAGSVTVQGKSWAIQMQSASTIYINHYSFGRVASSIAEKILAKSLEAKKTKINLTSEDLVTDQLKAISTTITKFGWLVVQRLSLNTLKESCGWCLSCRFSGDQGCLLNVTEKKFAEESKKASLGLRSIKNRKSHFAYAVHHLLFIEDNLHGLLSGPWQNPDYRKQWQKNVLKASDFKALKRHLLALEANLRRVALSADWLKSLPIDAGLIFGSAWHLLTVPVLDHSNNLGGRKRGRKSKTEINKRNLDAGLSGVYWWRGGRLSRQVFHWKVLPRLFAAKCARQAGCQKIPGLLYPEGSEFVKRSKFVAWRAAVEMSKTVAELIYYVKDLDSNIRWNDLKNASVFPILAKVPTKQRKPLKNVLIRRKCLDGDRVNYIVDFGRRKKVPDVVAKCAVMHQETSSGRKKYWLNEYDIPLGLLKAFEVKNLEQTAKRSKSDIKMPSDVTLTKLNRSIGFSYPFSNFEESECRKCAHCGEDVFGREAVSCQSCEGIFHRKHFRAPKSVTDAVYTCSACKKREVTKLKSSMGKDQAKRSMVFDAKLKDPSKKRKNTMILGSQKKIKLAKKGKIGRHFGIHDGVANLSNWCRRKRTAMQHSYWCNGLQWGVKQDDERGLSFRSTNILMPATNATYPCVNPICFLCHEEYNPNMIYLCCEKCGDWFHGDAVAVNLENVRNLIGFRCHKCRQTSIPICPYSRSESTPQVRLLVNNDGLCDTVANVHIDEVQCSSEHNDQQVALAGCLVEADANEELTGEFTFDTSQCLSPDKIFKTRNAEGALSDITQTGNSLHEDLRLNDTEVIYTEDFTSGKQTDISFVDLSCDLMHGNCEDKLTKFSTAQKHASFGKSQKCDTESKMLVVASLGQEDKSLDSKVLQVDLLDQMSISQSNSSPDCCNNMSGSHDGTANIMQHRGGLEHVDHSLHTEWKVGCTGNLVDKNQEESDSGGQFKGLAFEGSSQYPRRPMDELFKAMKTPPKDD